MAKLRVTAYCGVNTNHEEQENAAVSSNFEDVSGNENEEFDDEQDESEGMTMSA